MSPAKFLEAVRKGEHFEIVLLRGAEPYLLNEALREYARCAVPPESADFNYQEIRSSETSGEGLWNALTTLPFGADRRMVVLDISGELRKEVAEALAAYFKRPSATTSLVLTLPTESGKLEWTGSPPASLVDVEFATLRESERGAWISQYAERLGKRIPADSVTYLVQSASKSLSDLAATLNHAALYLGDEPDISVHVLMRVSGVSSEFTVFQLQDAILDRRPVEAHRIARSLLEGGEALLRLVSLHRGTMTRLWQISRLLAKPVSWLRSAEGEQAINSRLGGQVFKKNSFVGAARRLGESQIRRAIVELLELEVAFKTSSHEPSRYFEWLWRVSSDGWKSPEPAFQELR